jgi:uncharacterized protein (DUF2236 family)
MATVPLRLLQGLGAPARADLSGQLRRAIGLGRPPVRMSTDPAESYLPPDGVARLVHSDLPSMLIGGIGALLLQTLHPLAMAGVAEHSNYQADPLGRLRRTADFVGTTTFGTAREAERAELHAGPQALQARDWLRHGVSRRREQRAVYAVLHAAAVSTLPPWARAELGLSAPGPLDLLVDTVAVIPTSRAVSAALRWLATPQSAIQQSATGPQRAMVSPPSIATT